MVSIVAKDGTPIKMKMVIIVGFKCLQFLDLIICTGWHQSNRSSVLVPRTIQTQKQIYTCTIYMNPHLLL